MIADRSSRLGWAYQIMLQNRKRYLAIVLLTTFVQRCVNSKGESSPVSYAGIHALVHTPFSCDCAVLDLSLDLYTWGL